MGKITLPIHYTPLNTSLIVFAICGTALITGLAVFTLCHKKKGAKHATAVGITAALVATMLASVTALTYTGTYTALTLATQDIQEAAGRLGYTYFETGNGSLELTQPRHKTLPVDEDMSLTLVSNSAGTKCLASYDTIEYVPGEPMPETVEFTISCDS